MSAPIVPPRPTRSHHAGHSLQAQAMPTVPPRPTRRKDLSVSPSREPYARSPLNETPPVSMQKNKIHGHSNTSSSGLPRAPSVEHLPSVGQEGLEYASLEQDTPTEEDKHIEPQQTSIVSGDLPLHAPKASVPSSTAQSRISGVTRTDSNAAAAAGIGKADEEDNHKTPPPSGHPLKSKTSFNQSSSSLPYERPSSSRPASGRPPSTYENDEEHGIPEIGVQVPMYPNAGDVQAPTPQPFSAGFSTGIGYFNDSSQPGTRSQSSHGRRRSAQFTQPPGSYGLHGHGVTPKDPFEKDWYAKHPEALHHEEGEYGPSLQGHRNEWALSSEELNKLVHDTGKQRVGMATSPNVISVPDEQIGYIASAEYTSRGNSPLPPTATGTKQKRLSGSGTYAESPLRKTSFPTIEAPHLQHRETSDHAIETEDDIVHVDPPSRPGSKYDGAGYDPPTEDLGPRGGNTEQEGGWIVEQGEGVPILASDEVAKNPEAEFMQPAISPEQERRGNSYYAGLDSEVSLSYQSGWRSNSRPTSRPSSRPSSMHGAPNSLSRFVSHEEFENTGTPLEEIEEYEPLFPEDEKDEAKKAYKIKAAANQARRPDLARHHFPSEDVWEDTPSSLQLETTVKSPQLPEEKILGQPPPNASKIFEPPEAEHARKEVGKEDQQNFLPDHTKNFAKSHFNRDVLEGVASAGTRPGMQQRFPSQDIWEDSPSSMYLETTVKSPQIRDEVTSPPDTKSPESEKDRPSVPARPVRSKAGVVVAGEKGDLLSTTDRKAPPVIPERPKPTVPARPAKNISKVEASEVPAESSPLTKVTSLGSDTSSSATVPEKVNVAKVKPAPPARPAGGSKIAALKAGFMSDLQNKLQLGPQQVKKEEEEAAAASEPQETKPLSDARKGRARGPQRRKPGVSPASAATETTTSAASKIMLSFAQPTTLWSINEDDGALDVPSTSALAALEAISPAHKADSDPSLSKPTPTHPLPALEAENPLEANAKANTDAAGPATSTTTTTLTSPQELTREKPVQSTLDGEDPSPVPTTVSHPTAPPADNLDTQSKSPAAADAAEAGMVQEGLTASGKDEETQTGETEIVISGPREGDGAQKVTAFVGGVARDGGNVVVGEITDTAE